MTPEYFFDEIAALYKAAEDITEPYQRPDIYRGRQHSIASQAEDLLAAYLCDNLRQHYPDLIMHFMVDWGIKPDNKGKLMIPDVAIIVERGKAILASYLDVKTDLGYKRTYYDGLPALAEKVKRMRASSMLGKETSTHLAVTAAPSLIWRTVILSEGNASKPIVARNKAEAALYADYFKLYFLAGRKLPRRHSREAVEVTSLSFAELLADIRSDIEKAIALLD